MIIILEEDLEAEKNQVAKMGPVSAGWHQSKGVFHMCISSRNLLELDAFVELGLISKVLSPYFFLSGPRQFFCE